MSPAYVELEDAVQDDPERAWQLILGILGCNQSENVIACLAAGPLGNLLTVLMFCARLVVQKGDPMKTLNISEARNTLPALVESVSATRVPVMLLRYGKPAAMLVPVVEQATQANPYPLRGLALSTSADFDAPLSELWEACDVAEGTDAYQAKAKGQAKASRKGKPS